jgi:hypothetical protein
VIVPPTSVACFRHCASSSWDHRSPGELFVVTCVVLKWTLSWYSKLSCYCSPSDSADVVPKAQNRPFSTFGKPCTSRVLFSTTIWAWSFVVENNAKICRSPATTW